MVPARSSRHGISCSWHLSRSQAEIPLIPAVQISRASSVPTLDRKVVHRLPVVLPPADLRAALDDHLKPSFKLIDTLRAQNEQLASARDLLLPRLMDGRLEV
ncbi:restriction endonuclease subunit S [Rhizobium leguminosarum]|nr:restriction endonuclease subunit S [Rhizobium leguminosarum]